jgi:hypothetical protein
MSDILERLRGWSGNPERKLGAASFVAGALMLEAADHIDALVKALENLLCFLDNATDYELQHAANYSAYLDAKAALKPMDVGQPQVSGHE